MLIELTMAILFSVPTSAGGTCTPAHQSMGMCTVNDGTSIIIGGDQTTPGTGGGSGNGSGNGNGNPTTPPPPVPPWCAIDDPSLIYVTECKTDPPEPATPSVTISDLVKFTPPGTPITIEPYYIGIVGLPSNFVATTSGVYNTSGKLFGKTVQVRFTPDLHRFHYGDGTTKTVATKGRTWASLGVSQFTKTTTSHVYTARRIYTARVDILYTARVNFGNGWLNVSGHVTARGPERQIQIYSPQTALVAYTCTELPSAPGC
jgi:hypothetical protein